MSTRIALPWVCGVLLLGACTPNTPEPPPPPPVVKGEPVSQLPIVPMTEPPPTITPADPDKPSTTPTDPAPPKAAVNINEQIQKLSSQRDRQAAAVALASVGKSAVPALTQALDHADSEVRSAAVFALGLIGKDASEAQARLQKIAEKDEDSNVRDAAAFALDALAGK